MLEHATGKTLTKKRHGKVTGAARKVILRAKRGNSITRARGEDNESEQVDVHPECKRGGVVSKKISR